MADTGLTGSKREDVLKKGRLEIVVKINLTITRVAVAPP